MRRFAREAATFAAAFALAVVAYLATSQALGNNDSYTFHTLGLPIRPEGSQPEVTLPAARD